MALPQFQDSIYAGVAQLAAQLTSSISLTGKTTESQVKDLPEERRFVSSSLASASSNQQVAGSIPVASSIGLGSSLQLPQGVKSLQRRNGYYQLVVARYLMMPYIGAVHRYRYVPLAQLDKACGYEPQDREFESLKGCHVAVAQLVRALDCGSSCRGFEFHQSPHETQTAIFNHMFLVHTR